ncbi:MAG: hypothetical protein BWX86_02028 [Verrucomicrobia bacterium ADurb.Bin122]|nr:MAG: hypothetical protein BWX86_02028 [Verrucomicrobia bacterium ADurb.Bin122]
MGVDPRVCGRVEIGHVLAGVGIGGAEREAVAGRKLDADEGAVGVFAGGAETGGGGTSFASVEDAEPGARAEGCGAVCAWCGLRPVGDLCAGAVHALDGGGGGRGVDGRLHVGEGLADELGGIGCIKFFEYLAEGAGGRGPEVIECDAEAAEVRTVREAGVAEAVEVEDEAACAGGDAAVVHDGQVEGAKRAGGLGGAEERVLAGGHVAVGLNVDDVVVADVGLAGDEDLAVPVGADHDFHAEAVLDEEVAVDLQLADAAVARVECAVGELEGAVEQAIAVDLAANEPVHAALDQAIVDHPCAGGQHADGGAVVILGDDARAGVVAQGAVLEINPDARAGGAVGFDVAVVFDGADVARDDAGGACGAVGVDGAGVVDEVGIVDLDADCPCVGAVGAHADVAAIGK